MKLARMGIGLGVLGCTWGTSAARAQPWVVFEDTVSGSICEVVNTASEEFVVLDATGELVLVSGPDQVVPDIFVDVDNTVFFDGVEAGFIDFFEDGDGFATLWWVFDESGEVVELDDFFVPFPSGAFPDEFVNVGCDACEFWDDPLDCEFDEDLDGVPDEFDLCPGTPPNAAVDADGCPIVVRPPRPPGGGGGGGGRGGCGAIGAPAMVLAVAGFMGIGRVRRRNACGRFRI